ncbi:MAG TPA: AMP-binding protein [Acidimicrobiia bacterium]|jgi:acyl-CoA synthetase (AMP-forming)/AMP-acid ligase II|nr:AMP-binding protein [Acidimicrobiia bacterium]
MEIGEIVRRAAQRFGPTPALVFGDRMMTFSDLDKATDRVGNALLATGLRSGDRVGVLLPNGIDGLVVFYALAKAGLVRVPLNVRETPGDHAYKLTDSGSRAVIADQAEDFGVPTITTAFDTATLTSVMACGPDVPCSVPRHPDVPFRLGYTGGTTGRPKAVTLSMRCEHAEIASFLIDLLPDVRPGDRMLHAAPVVHASGAFVLPHLIRGATNIIMDRFDPGRFLEELERQAATATFLVPTMIAMVLDDPNVASVKAPALRRLCYGASPIAPALVERAMAAFGPKLAQTYGQAEAPMAITCLQPDEHDRIGSAGRPYTLVEVGVVDDDDRPLPPGEEGEVVTRGQHIFAGYWNRPAETAEVIRDGWVHTGDVGVFDDDGFLYLRDRKSDMIISGGYNVYPREVEDLLVSHPAVREAAVVGLPDERWGERVHAVMVLREDVAVDEILDFVAGRMAGFKRPKSAEVWDEPALPKSPAGKVLRRTIRERCRREGEVAIP